MSASICVTQHSAFVNSNRRGDFLHRTAIFEGAFRAWSYLGSLQPEVLDARSLNELDPTSLPRSHKFQHEPLPRSGLRHSFIQAVLSSWLGHNADVDTVTAGLKSLRIWWAHRRKGENIRSRREMHTDQMTTVVNKYTKHFFALAHCIVLSDHEQPPRTLYNNVKQMEKKEQNVSITMKNADPLIGGKGKCIPGRINLSQTVHSIIEITSHGRMHNKTRLEETCNVVEYGFSNHIPLVHMAIDKCGSVESNTMLLHLEGITCAHCIKIVETVLKGCQEFQTPIKGLLDATADGDMDAVLIKIDNPANARRIAFEAARNLSLVGYNAKAMTVALREGCDEESLLEIFRHHATTEPSVVFDWQRDCCCPQDGIYRYGCDRHGQMGQQLQAAFKDYEQRILEHIAGDRTLPEVDPIPLSASYRRHSSIDESIYCEALELLACDSECYNCS